MTESEKATSRREFLQGQAAAEALAAAVDRALPNPVAPPGVADPSYLFQIGRSAMACEFQVLLNAGQHPAGPDAALQALDLVDLLEDQLSIYRPHSEVSCVNRRAAFEPVGVEARLMALLLLAQEIHASTGGAFDMTSSPLSKVWGFSRRAGRMPDSDEIRTARELVGGHYVELDSERATIYLRKRDVEINLNAIGKGYALDRCAELLLSRGVTDFLIHGGQSSILARGSRAGLADGKCGWSVAVRNPLRPEQRLGEIWLQNRALGTSGTGTQFFYHNGRRYGHILDPRTGWPAESALSATVLAPTAAEADALATAFYVLGLGPSRDYCRSHADVGAVIVIPGERNGSIEVHLVGQIEAFWCATGSPPQ